MAGRDPHKARIVVWLVVVALTLAGLGYVTSFAPSWIDSCRFFNVYNTDDGGFDTRQLTFILFFLVIGVAILLIARGEVRRVHAGRSLLWTYGRATIICALLILLMSVFTLLLGEFALLLPMSLGVAALALLFPRRA